MMDKKQVARTLDQIGMILEIQGENPFKVRAYYTGARIVETLEEDLEEIVRSGTLQKIKGIGTALTKKITELVTTGRLEYFEKLKASFPEGIFEMMAIPNLGAKKIKILYERLGVSSIEELESACLENQLTDLPEFGSKNQEEILKEIDLLKKDRVLHRS
ncbi:MAG: hypothetical protein HY731_11805 [Candidatus Tectomicrobia bacterium]|nr:hypothetical protein [Candidatus Tectomicrobia bacterium]